MWPFIVGGWDIDFAASLREKLINGLASESVTRCTSITMRGFNKWSSNCGMLRP